MIAEARYLDFVLPPELEAHKPPEARGLRRDEVRLLVSYRHDDRFIHSRFTDLADFLCPGDLLVANDSATLPAAVTANHEGGDPFALHFSTHLYGQVWVVEPRKTEVHLGEVIRLPDGASATLLKQHGDSHRLWVALLDLPEPVIPYLDRWGRPIAYPYVPESWPIETYQTVYANEPGSAEMPSAGRAFSADVLEELAHKGVGFVALTLHTGVASLEGHETPYAEPYSVPLMTAEAVEETRANGGRVVAVGTTVVRTLEAAVNEHGCVIPHRGWTDLVITPERGIRVVDGLLTGFHEPGASHLVMLEAVSGKDHIAKAYRVALDAGYLWHEFGDLHLLLP